MKYKVIITFFVEHKDSHVITEIVFRDIDDFIEEVSRYGFVVRIATTNDGLLRLHKDYTDLSVSSIKPDMALIVIRNKYNNYCVECKNDFKSIILTSSKLINDSVLY